MRVAQEVKLVLLAYAELRKIPIGATTIQSAKGRAADFVFVTHFDDKFFIRASDKTAISDQDVCNFVVALTRARRAVFLISSKVSENMAVKPTFLNWIEGRRLEYRISVPPRDD